MAPDFEQVMAMEHHHHEQHAAAAVDQFFTDAPSPVPLPSELEREMAHVVVMPAAAASRQHTKNAQKDAAADDDATEDDNYRYYLEFCRLEYSR